MLSVHLKQIETNNIYTHKNINFTKVKYIFSLDNILNVIFYFKKSYVKLRNPMKQMLSLKLNILYFLLDLLLIEFSLDF